jgi:hypothetical protein
MRKLSSIASVLLLIGLSGCDTGASGSETGAATSQQASQAASGPSVESLGCESVPDQFVSLVEGATDESGRPVNPVVASAIVHAVSRPTGEWSIVSVRQQRGAIRHYVTDSRFFYLYKYPDDVVGWSEEEHADAARAMAVADSCVS